jgi:hypothetical protein
MYAIDIQFFAYLLTVLDLTSTSWSMSENRIRLVPEGGKQLGYPENDMMKIEYVE